MTKAIHGKSTELDEDLGVADGQEIEVQVKIIPPARPWGEGILRSAGGWIDYTEMDAIMEKIRRDRKLERRPRISEPRPLQPFGGAPRKADSSSMQS